MVQKIKPIGISLCLLSIIAQSAFAQATHNTISTQSYSTQSLERQVAQLRQEVNALKSAPSPTVSYPRNTPNPMAANAAPSQVKISGPQYLPQKGAEYIPLDIHVPGQSFVSTGPYIGVPLQYNGSDLIVNNPSVNEDVSLLNLRKNIAKRLCDLGITDGDEHSHLLLSGVIEAEAAGKRIANERSSSDIDITNAGLDAYILGTEWTTGLISIRYDNSIGAQEGSFFSNARTQNSRVVIDKAFIVIGNFRKCPFYMTVGQMYVPFGTYSSSMISSPLTKLLFRTQARAILFGYQQQCDNAFYAAGYFFKGDSRVGSSNNRINNGGINLGYKYDLHCGKTELSGNFGGGVIANIADSQGMQNNGYGAVYVPATLLGQTATFGGFGGIAGSGSEVLAHRVPAFDLRGLFSIGKEYDFLIEYITASRSFSQSDLTYQSHGARPQALNAEAAYTFQGLVHPTSVSVGYGMTKDALALAMPRNRYVATVNTSLWKNTIESIEFRHDNNYPASAASSGSGIPGPTVGGRSDNVVTAQIDIYF